MQQAFQRRRLRSQIKNSTSETKSVPPLFPGNPSYKVPAEVNPRKILKLNLHICQKHKHDTTLNRDEDAVQLLLNFSQNAENTSFEFSNENTDSTNNFNDEVPQMEIDITSPNVKFTQTKISMQSISKLYVENRRLQKLICAKNKTISTLREKLEVANKKLDYYKKKCIFQTLRKWKLWKEKVLQLIKCFFYYLK